MRSRYGEVRTLRRAASIIPGEMSAPLNCEKGGGQVRQMNGGAADLKEHS